MKTPLERWMLFILSEYPLLLKITIPMLAIIYIRHTMTYIDADFMHNIGTVMIAALVFFSILLLAKALFEHKLEIKRLRSILSNHKIDSLENEAIINKDML